MWLHSIGEVVRDALSAVPMSWVRLLFVLFPLLLLVWVCRLPREATREGEGGTNLKWAAAAALAMQTAVYLFEWFQGS